MSLPLRLEKCIRERGIHRTPGAQFPAAGPLRGLGAERSDRQVPGRHSTLRLAWLARLGMARGLDQIPMTLTSSCTASAERRSCARSSSVSSI
jgi:hypothetical protein